MPEPQPLQQLDRTYVRWSGRKLSYFAGCDYFRLSSHSKVKRALLEGLKRYGLSVNASRMTSGNHAVYQKLEKALARFFGAEAALFVPTGYLTNVIVAQALSGQFSHALLDEAVHPSLRDAANQLECPVLNFAHRSLAGLNSVLARCGQGCKVILLTDGMFARDGSVAPLREYRQALPKDGVILVDDAHGAGVLGKHGRGALEYTGPPQRAIILTVTLSKAFGTYGGAILGSAGLRNRILEHSPLFIGSTPLPLPLAHAALQSLKIVGSDKSLRLRLARNVQFVREELARSSIGIPATPGPIIALEPQGRAAIKKIQRALLASDIYPSFIRYPGGPASGYFRFVISSEHTREQLDNLARTIRRLSGALKPLSLS